MSGGGFGWFDRYDYVDRLGIRPRQMFPVMRWWEWVWYVVVTMAGAILLEHLHAWLLGLLQDVTILRVIPWVVSGPLVATMFVLGCLFLLPARHARAEARGEGWLMAALWALAFAGEAVAASILGLSE